MRVETVPFPGRLIMGVLWSPNEGLEAAEEQVADMFGPVGYRSQNIPFSKYTDYYESEMGTEIYRCLWGFQGPFQRGSLVEAKLATNRTERALAKSGKRTVNLDPGLLTLEAVNLATTKPYYHRFYLAKGIYGELALVFRNGGYEPLPWTYPDYREPWAAEFFLSIRGELLEEHREKKS